MTTTTTDPNLHWSRRLLQHLDLQAELAADLQGIVDEQAGLVERSDTDGLLGLLNRRQHLLDRLLEAQRAVQPMIEELDDRLPTLDDTIRERIRSRLDEIASALHAIMKADERDQQALSRQRDDSGRELNSANVTRGARRAYQRTVGAGGTGTGGLGTGGFGNDAGRQG